MAAESPSFLSNPDALGSEVLRYTTRPSRTAKFFKVFRILTLVFSALLLCLIIANYIILRIAPFERDVYRQRRINGQVLAWIISSLIAFLINVFILVSALINVAGDFTFAVGAIVSMVRRIQNMPFQSCQPGYNWNTGQSIPPPPQCNDWKLTLDIIMGFTAAFGILLAASYVSLLLLRAYEIFKSRFWEKSSWSIPTGEITWTIKLNVTSSSGDERTYGLSARANSNSRDPPASHGQVHL